MGDFQINDLGAGRFSLSGSITFETADRVLKASKAVFGKQADFELDCSGVTEADSAGLALLLEWKAWARRHRASIRYLGLPKSIVAIARTTGVEDLI